MSDPRFDAVCQAVGHAMDYDEGPSFIARVAIAAMGEADRAQLAAVTAERDALKANVVKMAKVCTSLMGHKDAEGMRKETIALKQMAEILNALADGAEPVRAGEQG